MSSGRRIRHLAKKAGLDPHEALELIRAAGLPYDSPQNQVSRGRLNAVSAALGLEAPGKYQAPEALPQPDPELSISPPQVVNGSSAAAPKGRKDPNRSQPRPRIDLETIGRPVQDISYLTKQVLLDIHWKLVEDFHGSNDPLEPPGLRDDGALLESALSRPRTSLGPVVKYPSIEMAAAALLHSIVQDHPFCNGNKRTGIVALLVFLDLNGFVLMASQEELFDYVLNLASHNVVKTRSTSMLSDSEALEASRWIQRNSRKLNKQEKCMPWRKLEPILSFYGCTVEQGQGNKLKIRRNSLTSISGARNSGAEIDQKDIAHIRSELELDEAHGIDSEIFYTRGEKIPDFINKYRQLLTKLAKF